MENFIHFIDAGLDISTAYVATYNAPYVIASLLISIVVPYMALNLADHVHCSSSTRDEIIWLFPASITLGGGVWSMHFIGMLAFSLPGRIYYDPTMTLISLLSGIIAYAGALWVARHSTVSYLKLLIGGVLMGAGVSIIHYIDIASMRIAASIYFSPWLYALSVGFAITLSTLALYARFAFQRLNFPIYRWVQLLTVATIMGIAISGMHYIAMQAVFFLPLKNSLIDTAVLLEKTFAVDVIMTDFALVALILAGIIFARYMETIGRVKREIDTREVAEHSNSVLSQAVEQSSAIVIITDRYGKIEYVNRSFVETSGYTAEEAIGKTSSIIKSGLTTQEEYANMWDTINAGKAWSGAFYNKKKNGQLFWEKSLITPIMNLDGSIDSFLSIGEDITELKRDQAALKDAKRRARESDERYALVIDGMRDPVWDYNILDNTLYTSSRFSDLLGYEVGEMNLTFQDWMDRVHPATREKYKSHLSAHLEGETAVYACEYQIAQKNGGYIWVLDRGKAIFDETGRAYRMAGSVSDITKRRLAEDGQRQSQKLAAVGQFSSGIAHEFNNILVGIRGFTDMAIMDAENPKEVCSHLAEVQEATDRAAKMTKDMLAFSRGQDIKVTQVKFDLCDMIDEAAAFLKPILSKNVHLHTDIAKRDILIYGDPQQISQIILNLSVNGKDAMLDGGDLTIGIRTVEYLAPQLYKHPSMTPGHYAQLFISDTGTGIDDKTLQRLFEPFFTTKDYGKGTGLGLSVVHGFITQMNGFIDIESKLGKGTTFFVNLPLFDTITLK